MDAQPELTGGTLDNVIDDDTIQWSDDDDDMILELISTPSSTPQNSQASSSAVTLCTKCKSQTKPKPKIKCPECPKEYCSDGWLKRHMQAAHGISPNQRPPVDVESAYNHALAAMDSDSMLKATPLGNLIILDIKNRPSNYKHAVTIISQSSNIHRDSVNDLNINSLYYAHFERFILSYIGSVYKVAASGSVVASGDEPATPETLAATYYVSGAILRSLRKRVGWSPDTIDLLSQWTLGRPDETLPSLWTTLVDRGGLVHVSKEFFDWVKTMDRVSTRALSFVTSNCNLTEYLMDILLNDDSVSDICQGLNDDLVYTCTRIFSSIRCKAYVRQAKSATSSASLRQNLMGATKRT